MSGSPGAGIQALGSHSAAFLGTLATSYIESGAAGFKPAPQAAVFCLLCHSVGARKSFLFILFLFCHPHTATLWETCSCLLVSQFSSFSSTFASSVLSQNYLERLVRCNYCLTNWSKQGVPGCFKGSEPWTATPVPSPLKHSSFCLA